MVKQSLLTWQLKKCMAYFEVRSQRKLLIGARSDFNFITIVLCQKFENPRVIKMSVLPTDYVSRV